VGGARPAVPWLPGRQVGGASPMTHGWAATPAAAAPRPTQRRPALAFQNKQSPP
jgi:hypothetical protein